MSKKNYILDFFDTINGEFSVSPEDYYYNQKNKKTITTRIYRYGQNRTQALSDEAGG
jgi:hypothetical protein